MWYQEAIGTLIYVVFETHLDIAYTIHILSKFSKNPGIDHRNITKWVSDKSVEELRLMSSLYNFDLVVSWKIQIQDKFKVHSYSLR